LQEPDQKLIERSQAAFRRYILIPCSYQMEIKEIETNLFFKECLIFLNVREAFRFFKMPDTLSPFWQKLMKKETD
jgi:hypothetical protein